jgi:hypothetical protein
MHNYRMAVTERYPKHSLIIESGSGQFLNGSGSGRFQKSDPDPELNKCLAGFLLEIFLAEIGSKSIFMNKKSLSHRYS